MFVGHYSAAFAIKALHSRTPLWVLFVAVQLVDLVWALLVLSGIEKLRVVPGFMEASALDLYYMPYSHSLIATFVFAGAALLIYRYWRRSGWLAAVAIAVAVATHWWLDLVVHGPDLPLYGNLHKVGLGLWNSKLGSYLVEIGLLGAAVLLFVRRTRPQGRLRTGSIVFAVALVGIQALNTFRHPFESATLVVLVALASYLAFIGVAFWLERGSPEPG